jgi:muconolactone delta-isomerase
MGGFTEIHLKNKDNDNISKHNVLLELLKVPKNYSFYSMYDIIYEYETFKQGLGSFPEDMFPEDKINSLEDFMKYWNTEVVGKLFVPEIGSLTLDCYYGRTSDKTMRKIGKWVANNLDEIDHVGGSFSTFIEKGCTKKEQKYINKNAKFEI